MALIGQDFSSWHALVNEAALAAFAVGVCFTVYKVLMHGGKKLAELGERYVMSTETLHDTLAKSDQSRAELCARHADGLEVLSETMQEGTSHLQRLVQLHEATGPVGVAVSKIDDAKHDMSRVKKSIRHACDMCRSVSAREFPNSAADVGKHCDEIERAIGSDA